MHLLTLCVMVCCAVAFVTVVLLPCSFNLLNQRLDVQFVLFSNVSAARPFSNATILVSADIRFPKHSDEAGGCCK